MHGQIQLINYLIASTQVV